MEWASANLPSLVSVPSYLSDSDEEMKAAVAAKNNGWAVDFGTVGIRLSHLTRMTLLWHAGMQACRQLAGLLAGLACSFAEVGCLCQFEMGAGRNSSTLYVFVVLKEAAADLQDKT